MTFRSGHLRVLKFCCRNEESLFGQTDGRTRGSQTATSLLAVQDVMARTLGALCGYRMASRLDLWIYRRLDFAFGRAMRLGTSNKQLTASEALPSSFV